MNYPASQPPSPGVATPCELCISNPPAQATLWDAEVKIPVCRACHLELVKAGAWLRHELGRDCGCVQHGSDRFRNAA